MTLSDSILLAVQDFCASFSSSGLQEFEDICHQAALEQPGIRCEDLFPQDSLQIIDHWILSSCNKKDQAARHLNQLRKIYPATARPCQLVADFGNVQSSWRFLRGLRHLLEHATYAQVLEAIHLARDQRTSAPNPGRTHRGVSSKKAVTPADTKAARLILKIPSPSAGKTRCGGKRASSEPLLSQPRHDESEPESSEAPTPERGRCVTEQESGFHNKRRRLSGYFTCSAGFEAPDLMGLEHSGEAELDSSGLNDTLFAYMSSEPIGENASVLCGSSRQRRHSNTSSVDHSSCSNQDDVEFSPHQEPTWALQEDDDAEVFIHPGSSPQEAVAASDVEETSHAAPDAIRASRLSICRDTTPSNMVNTAMTRDDKQHEYDQTAGSESDDSLILVPDGCLETPRPSLVPDDGFSITPSKQISEPSLSETQNVSKRRAPVPDETVGPAGDLLHQGRDLTEMDISKTLNQFNPDPEKWLVVKVMVLDASRPLADQEQSPEGLHASQRSLIMPLSFGGGDSDMGHFTVAFLDRQERSIIVYDPWQDVEYIRTSMRWCEAFARSLSPLDGACKSADGWKSRSSECMIRQQDGSDSSLLCTVVGIFQMFETRTPLTITPCLWRRVFASMDADRDMGTLPPKAIIPIPLIQEPSVLRVEVDDGYARAIESLLARAKSESVCRRERIRAIGEYIDECECARQLSLTICERAEALSEQFNETVASLIYQSRLLGEQQILAPRRLDEWPKYVSAHHVAKIMSLDIEAYRRDQSSALRQAEYGLNDLRAGCASVVATIDRLCLTDKRFSAELP